MSGLVISGLGVRYGAGRARFQALRDVDLLVASGTFVTLLGPSGSGKTTLLRCVAGLITPTEGRIEAGDGLFYDAATGLGLPTRERNLGMVFQTFALWPHMTVAENIGFPLRMKNWPRARRDSRVQELLELIGLPGLGGRYPSQLSGGQQQRVGLARAIAGEPSLLLMDEPLSSLDARLREEMRSYIRRLQKTLGITVLYVTHDREEALGLSDVVVILSGGRVMSAGTPRQLYREPPETFTATFLADWSLVGSVDELAARGAGDWLQALPLPPSGSNSAVVLPMEITEPLVPEGEIGTAHVAAELMNAEFLGTSVRLELRLGGIGHSVFVSQTGKAGEVALRLPRGARVGVPASALRVLPHAGLAGPMQPGSTAP